MELMCDRTLRRVSHVKLIITLGNFIDTCFVEGWLFKGDISQLVELDVVRRFSVHAKCSKIKSYSGSKTELYVCIHVYTSK